MDKRGMLVEDERIDYLLEGIANSIVQEPWLRQDLLQEARLHIWRLERERPGQSTSWYLQSCRFRMQHYLGSGKSVDSRKRRSGHVMESEVEAEASTVLEQLETEDRAFEETCTRDLVLILSGSLKAPERAVLNCLAAGLPTSDIARWLKLSTPTVT